MSAKQVDIILGSDNLFHRELAMRMTLARKELLTHVQVMKPEAEITETWMYNGMKDLGIIALGVSLEHQTKIRSATPAIQAFNTLREF